MEEEARETVALPPLKAGPLDVVYKIRHKGVKVCICKYLDTYLYFFALGGEVYLDYLIPPHKLELKAHKTTLNEIEPKLISHLCSKAIENIEFNRAKRSKFQQAKKFLINHAKTGQRWLHELKSGLFDHATGRQPLKISVGRPEGPGDEHESPAGQAAEASGVRG